VNHGGSVEAAVRLIDAAAAAGADAVKFQMFQARELAAPAAPAAQYQKAGEGNGAQRDMLRDLELSFEQFARLERHCRAREILFLATPFGECEVQALVDLGAPAIKIASTDLNNVRLLDAAAATRLPLIVSTGASTEEEIRACIEGLCGRGAGGRLILMHCVSCYPTPIVAANLSAIRTLGDTFGVPCGFSDHTVSLDTGSWAVAGGACVLEKHLTLDRSQQGPDHAMSLDPRQFAEYVHRVREVEAALGSGALGMDPIEADVRTVARRSVVAARDISGGSRISEDMLTLKRPGTGIPADEIGQVIGRIAAADIAADSLLSWNQVR
jgi:N-acetylneuraminate synthase/N,N'-diacetyllegionaminate synthase